MHFDHSNPAPSLSFYCLCVLCLMNPIPLLKPHWAA
ncbi:hypothetical protein AG1IA_09773 [Rhizoctonia solani AG-1 IA]|uniref:Uncharacterized protein n=1 Tax=Thanatephorus cucumeris (strain AG1-IA) TaxID=983506 RepID=L8WHJ6_THACA|nr:hypothetical protein AG1IA_09773 [Rhizoctonia solani AG-1 IA]